MSAGASGTLRVLFGAGGTAGHVFPAIAVAEALREREPGAAIAFVGETGGPGESLVRDAGHQRLAIAAQPIRGGSALRVVRGLLCAPGVAWECRRLLREWRPHVVVGTGGFVAGPLLLSARAAGVPTLLVEPNVVPGLANRWLAPWVNAAAVARPETALALGRRAFVSGNPIRRVFAGLDPVPAPAADGKLRLLVLTGSQGSGLLNALVPAALAILGDLSRCLVVLHQSGPGLADATAARYRAAGLPAEVVSSIVEIAGAYRAAHLVVSAAGAGACAEIAAAGRPSVLVPLAVAGDHQRHNAAAMARAGAALALDAPEPRTLAQELSRLLDDRELRARIAGRARELARPEAARCVAARVLELAAARRA